MEPIPKVVIYPDKAGEFRWRLVAGNNEIQASGESHSTVEHAKEAVTNVAKNLARLSTDPAWGDFELSEDFVEVLTVDEAEAAGYEVGS